MKHIYYNVFVCEDSTGRLLMEQRPEEGLLANMWQFPMIEQGEDCIETFTKLYGVQAQEQQEILTFKHIFSHLTWHINSYYMKCTTTLNGQWLTREQIELLPMPVPMLKIWQKK